MNRKPSFNGSFYPSNKTELTETIKTFFKESKREKKTNCVIVPHAGYPYSGLTAAKTLSKLKENEINVLLGPNHSGLGNFLSIAKAEQWETTLGKVKVSREKEKLNELIGYSVLDDKAFEKEHSLEVLLPLLQELFANKEFSILPVCIAFHDLEVLEKLGESLFELEESLGKELNVIASTDFTHFEREEKAKEIDFQAIELIKKLDYKGFHEFVLKENASICGFAGVTALMVYARKKGLKKVELIEYTNSGKATGDYSSVVAYAGIVFE
ncbi:MAG: AmmeMemoRadiSam system protein B [archaeon]